MHTRLMKWLSRRYPGENRSSCFEQEQTVFVDRHSVKWQCELAMRLRRWIAPSDSLIVSGRLRCRAAMTRGNGERQCHRRHSELVDQLVKDCATLFLNCHFGTEWNLFSCYSKVRHTLTGRLHGRTELFHWRRTGRTSCIF